jgi:hypothetical protein
MECLMDIVDKPEHRLIRLVGRLTVVQVHELLCAARSSHRSVHLNLNELISVDAVGLEVLHQLGQEGAQFVDVPTYIQLKLASLAAKHGIRQD